LFFAALALAPLVAVAQSGGPRPAPKFIGGKPDQQEGAQVLAGFRQTGIAGHYWAKFELRVMPRKGEERLLTGEMFGSPGAGGALTRLVVDDSDKKSGSSRQIYLLQGAPGFAAWTWNAGEPGLRPHQVEGAALLAPVQGTDLTVFDLQMPFLSWTDFVYEGVANVRSRPAHVFLLYPPADFPREGPAAVRVYLDTQFGAMTQAEWIDGAGKPLKSVTVLDLKKVGEQWILKSIDLRNHTTRAKTRLSLTAAALGLPAWARDTFEPAEISRAAPVVPADRVERF